MVVVGCVQSRSVMRTMLVILIIVLVNIFNINRLLNIVLITYSSADIEYLRSSSYI